MTDSDAPHAAPLPGDFEALAPFQRLLLVRCLRCAPGICHPLDTILQRHLNFRLIGNAWIPGCCGGFDNLAYP